MGCAAAPRAALRTRITASYLGSGYYDYREQARSHICSVLVDAQIARKPAFSAKRTAVFSRLPLYSPAFKSSPTSAARHGNQPDP